jgi:hypothetical protein
MTDLQLAAIISQALYVGSVHNHHKDDDDFDELVFRNYARGMLNIILRNINAENERAVEKALDDFLAGFEI